MILTSSVLQLVDAVFETAAMTITRASKVLGISHRAATMTVSKLVDAGILQEVGHSGRTRLLLAPGILRTVNGETGAESTQA